jgi:hypothetical protein
MYHFNIVSIFSLPMYYIFFSLMFFFFRWYVLGPVIYKRVSCCCEKTSNEYFLFGKWKIEINKTRIKIQSI